MNFIFKMAWRDTRASRRRLALYALSIVLGVAALTGISSLGEALRTAVTAQAKGVLGADVAVTSREDFSPRTLARLRAAGGELALGLTVNTMAGFAEGPGRLVQLAASDPAFPFYGDVETAPANRYAALTQGRTALVEEAALTQAGLAPGGTMRLGRETVTIAGALLKFPGQSPMASMFAPRVQVSLETLRAAGLLQRGSLVSYGAYLRLPGGNGSAEVAKKLREELKGERLQITTADERQEQIGESLAQVFSFISLVGFLALFLGAVGIASALHVYIHQRLPTVAVLRCLGASLRTTFAIYLIQGVGLGLFGTLLGIGLGLGLQAALPVLLRSFLPFTTVFAVSWVAVGKGLAAGVGVSALFTLLPLLEVRRAAPLRVLRSDFEPERGAFDGWRAAVYAAIVVALAGLAVWQTGSVGRGLGFAAAMGVSFVLLAATSWGLIALARRLPVRWLPYPWRQGFANIHRPQNRTLLLIMSLGLGTFLLLTLGLTRSALLSRLEGMGSGQRPNLVFFDVQPDQIAALEAIARREGMPLQKTSPIVTMRLVSIKGRTTEAIAADGKDGRPNWALRREYRSTWRSELDEAEQLVAGHFTGRVAADATAVPVSVEESLARDLHLKLGDPLVFDVQGVTVSAVIGSIRKVEWRRLQTNFFFVFPAGPLDAAPATYAASARAESPAATARLQRAVARELPNVSAIDLGFILRLFDSIFTKISWAISFLASFTVITGVVVLIGAVLIGRHQRVKEVVLLRTLGAQRSQLRQMLLAEYTVLGLLAALAGGILAVGASALLARFIFKVPAAPAWPPLVAAVVGVTLLTVLTGLLANRGVSGQPPLEILREEG